MAENNNNKEKPNFGNMRPMNKAPKINPYWIYGVIIIAFLAIQWFTLGGGPVETNWKDVKTNMLPTQRHQKDYRGERKRSTDLFERNQLRQIFRKTQQWVFGAGQNRTSLFFHDRIG